MELDLQKFYDIVATKILDVAEYQKARCGKVKNLSKSAQIDVENTPIHSALTYIDMFTQDYLMIPLFKEFPQLVPVVEENTGMKQRYINNKSDYDLIIDPIDGTSSYCKGEKDYSIMVGLLHKGKMVVGIGCYPETKEIYAAIKGKGAWKLDPNGKRIDLLRLENIKYNEKNVATHYRFLKEPFKLLSDRLHKKGYKTPTNGEGFGTNLSGILRIAEGKSCAFIGPHMALHDFGVPSLIIEELGGIVKIFDYNGKNDLTSWTKKENVFSGLDPRGANPRFRIIIANKESTINELIKNMQGESNKV